MPDNNATSQPTTTERGYSFTDHSTYRPYEPQPGDRLDAEFDRLHLRITLLRADMPPALPVQITPLDADSDAEAAAIQAQKDQELAYAWAEYLDADNPIPPAFYAHTAITGQHWSSRWWAVRAATVYGGVLIGESPPGTMPGLLWWDSATGQLYIQYNDGTSVQWVSANSPVQNPDNQLVSVITPTIVAGALTLDLAAAGVFRVNFNVNITAINIVNATAGKITTRQLELLGDGTARTINFGAWTLVTGPAVPTATLGRKDLYDIRVDGTKVLVWLTAQNIPA